MKTKNIFTGLFALLVISLLGIGASFAHGGGFSNNVDENNGYSGMGYGMMGSNMGNMYEMHNEMSNLFTTGSYEDLESFRNKYGMPAMYWIENEEDLDNFRNNDFNMGTGVGYGMMR